MLLKNGILADIQDNLIRKRRGSDVLPFFYIRKKRKSLLVKRTIRLEIFFRCEKYDCEFGDFS